MYTCIYQGGFYEVKKILILALIISSTVTLLGCSNSSSKEVSLKENSTVESNTSDKDNNSTETEKTEESSSNASKPANSLENKNTDTNNSKNTNSNPSTSAKKQEQDTSLNYKSKLGFSLTFPTNWKNRYIVKEDDNSMYVYFKSSDPNTPKNSGLLFFIKKNFTQDDENMSDSVLSNGRRHITVGNTTYLVGGPTDVNLNEDNKDFQIFLSMHKECEQVINTIKR